jgi:HPt (histidine-containing phosphotransfer) domain-containing protein
MGGAVVLDPAVIDSLRRLTPPGEPDVLTEVLRLFLDEVPRRIERLRAAWTDGNLTEVHRAAHSLKGSAGNIGARALSEVCRQLDERGKAGHREGTADLVAALGVEFGKVEREIRRLLGAGPT